MNNEKSSYIQKQKLKISMEIKDVNNKLLEVSIQSGTTSPEYEQLSEKLTLLLKEETLFNQMDNYVEELFKIYMQRGIQHHETIKISEKLDEIIIQYQKLKLIN
ncbi:hypothetical protein J2Z40_002802 [Cytobacillus eiseniae]|uniref:Aspartyl-phosphate phosphatase Spo0E family protein n=1 Tax=Cytobacillus eiseniae TaxID=762947 RepID=A0ABS4RHK0_9BACI|nr:hypothetical protein [Cytobacillus eiseniae]